MGCESTRRHETISKEYKMSEVVRLAKQGMKQTDILKDLQSRGIAISSKSICTYLADARKEWRKTLLDDMDTIMERELSKLDRMESDAESLFETFNPNTTDLEIFASSKEASEWVKARLKIMETRHKLLGLYKPIKLDVESKNENINVNAEQSDEIRREILSRLSPKSQ